MPLHFIVGWGPFSSVLLIRCSARPYLFPTNLKLKFSKQPCILQEQTEHVIYFYWTIFHGNSHSMLLLLPPTPASSSLGAGRAGERNPETAAKIQTILSKTYLAFSPTYKNVYGWWGVWHTSVTPFFWKESMCILWEVGKKNLAN